MKHARNLFVLAVAASLLGCSGSDQMSPADEAALKQSFTKGGDPSVMTDDQKKAMNDYMQKNMGGKPGAPPAGTGAAPN